MRPSGAGCSPLAAAEATAPRAPALWRITATATSLLLGAATTALALAPWPSLLATGLRNTALGLAVAVASAVILPVNTAWMPLLCYLPAVFLFGHHTAGADTTWWASPVLSPATPTTLTATTAAALLALAAHSLLGTATDRQAARGGPSRVRPTASDGWIA